ncbi:MAG: hypothetical protein WD894_14710 [Pirellulales bacterium]
MKRLSLLLYGIALATTSSALAQEPDDPFVSRTPPRTSTTMPAQILSPGEVTATPEMWFYEQERLRDADPRQAVRARAEYRALQRSRRLAALKWFGFSNSRPIVNSDPFHSTYSPRWVGNGYLPSYWVAGSPTPVVIAPDRVRRY